MATEECGNTSAGCEMASEPVPESSDIDSSSSPSSSSLSSSSSDTDATSSEDENDPSVCSLCYATDRVTTQISGCDELKSIMEYIESSSSAVKKVKYACQTCLYKLYTIIDQNRLKAFKAEREQRLAAVAALIESTGAPTPSILNDSAETDNMDSPESSPSPRVLVPEEAQNVITAGEVHSPSPCLLVLHDANDESNTSNILSDRVAERDRPSDDADTEEPEFEQNKQPLVNGNSDVISNSSYSPTHLDIMYEQSEAALITESGGTLDQYKNPPLQCRYCPKVFVRQKPFNKHMRSHQAKVRSMRSGSSSRGRNTPTNVIYACTECSATFDSSTKLKNHCRIHLKRFYCTYCHKENLSLYDHEFHEAECKGVQMAQEDFVETRRVTRSVTRSRRSGQSTKPPKSILSRRNSSAKTKHINYDCDEDEDEDDDCATSVAYTDYTGVNSYVEKWVAGTCRSEYGRRKLSQYMDQEETVVVSQKEYEIIMLERLLKQSSLNVYTCCVLNCDYVTNTLREMCLHEILIHKYKTFYSCRKCRGVFTSKLFLDYHFYMQTYAEYRCNKCPMHFNYEYQLQYHLLQHQKTEPHPCLYCGDSYLTAQELRIHCIETTHDPKKRKKNISIDHTMTIVNETAPEPPPPKRTYTCTINPMKLPKMPTKRPMNIPWPKGVSPLFLGDIDFEYQPRKNCVRTK